jgi:hypothetical protein
MIEKSKYPTIESEGILSFFLPIRDFKPKIS